MKTESKFPNNDFELPIITDPAFSRPPRLPFDVCVKLCEEMLEWQTGRPGFEAKRLASKTPEEFIL
jgi:hypothetical protein